MPVIVFTKAVGLIEVAPQDKVFKDHVCMIAEDTLDVNLGLPFYITIANLGKADVYVPKL